MATKVFRTRLHYDYDQKPRLLRSEGEAVVMEGERYVRQFDGLLITAWSSEWHYTQREADLAVLPLLEDSARALDEIRRLIDSRPVVVE